MSNRKPMNSQQVQRIKALISSKGVGAAAALMGCATHTLERAAGGLDMNPGTAALLAQKIAERDSQGKVP